MKKVIGLSALVFSLGLMGGCASRNEMMKRMDELHANLHQLEAKYSQVEDTANKALQEASSAHEHAAHAESLAKECKRMCEAHMEKMFHKSMMK